LANSGLDFLVLCSTRSTIASGAVYGQVGYVAANEFLDAFAFYKRATDDIYTLTINWDAWRDVGMAVRVAKNQAGIGQMGRELTDMNSLSEVEGAEAFHRLLNYSFARVIVTAMPLDAPERNLSVDQHITQHLTRRLPATKPEAAPTQTKHARPAKVGMVFAAPTNKVERELAHIWQELLGIQEVGVDDNFFDLGGDSLLLLRVQASILETLKTNLSSAEMFQHTTIRMLSRRLGQPTAEPAGLGSVQDRAALQRAAMGHRQSSKPR
jgi:polyketide synthase PksJ